jgi:hypothetical protein
MSDLDLTKKPNEVAGSSAVLKVSEPYDPNKEREGTRGDLARGLLWLLALVIGGVLVFVGLGQLEGSVITQSIFPSVIALAGTALGFYFGSQSGKNGNSPVPASTQPFVFTPGGVSGSTDSSKTASPPSADSTKTDPQPASAIAPSATTGGQTDGTDNTTGAGGETDTHAG